MSNNVDRRIVEMQFDNKDFERNIQASAKSLDSLKKSLNLEESAKGLTALEKAGRHFSLDGMAAAAEAVTSKFSIMGTVGDQVLRRMTDAAFNAFSKMKGFVDSLTIQPIYTGFQEYETQINAIQTILSNTRDELTKKGYDDAARLELVNEKLDQLNHYADKTIYNFTEMTRNIGTFTAAGVELETAVDSIQGIANLAAVSGSTSEQASRAMYQLSQAISTGTVRLMDWNSVVNAGMGGKVFQDALVRTATAMGITVDKTVKEVNSKGKTVTKTVKRTVKEIIEEEGSFRESLSSGWLSADVLTATLEQFSWDFEQIAEDTILDDAERESLIQKLAEMYVGQGDDAEKALERAKAMIGDMTNLSVEAVKEIKKGELLASGYTSDEADEIIRLAQDATEAATKVKTFTQLFDTLKEAAQSGWTQTWEYIIGDFEEAKEMLTGISDFFGAIIDSSASARNKIMQEWHDNGGRDMLFNNDPEKGALGAFWNLVYSIQNIVSLIREEFQKIFPPTTSQTLLTFTEKIQQATANFKTWTENSEKMERIRQIIAGIAAGFDIVKSAIGYVWRGGQKLFGFAGPAAENMLDFAAGIGGSIVKMRDALKTSEGFQSFLQRIGAIAEKANGVISRTFDAGAKAITNFWGKVKSSGMLTKIGEGIGNFVGKIPDAIDKVKNWTKSVIEYVKHSQALQKAWINAKNFFEPVLKQIMEFGKRLKEALKAFFEKDVSGEKGLVDKLKARLSAFGGAFSDWYASVKDGASTAWANIKNFLSNFFTKTIPDFFSSSDMSASSILGKIQEIDWGKVLKTVLGVATFAKVLNAVRDFSKIGKIADSFKKLTGTIKDIAKNGASLTKDGLIINGKQKKSPLADTLLKVAASIGILVASIYVLAKMDTTSVVKGVGILTLIAGELLVVSALFSKMNLDGGSVLKAAAAILLLVIPIKLLSSMKMENALKGILTIGLILTELALFTRMAGKEFNGKQAGFIGMSIAINLMVLAIKSLSKLDIGGMAKSLIGMEVLLLEMASFTKKVSGKKVAGIIAMALGINLMVSAVKRMGNLNTKTIIKGVLGLGGIMTAFGVMVKMSKGVNLSSALVLLLTMAGSLIIFMEAFRKIEGSNTEDMLRFSLSFSAMMASMSVALKVLSSIPIAGALKGVANMAILIVGLGALVVGLGYLQSQWQGMTDFLEGGGNVLGQIGRAIGKFVGGIGAGFAEGLNLPQLGTDLSNFMTNASGFIEGAKSVDTSSASGVGNLTAAIIKIAGAEFVSALVSLFTGENPVTKFSGDLVTLGNGLSAYGASVLPLASIPDAVLDRSIAVAGALADVAGKIPATGGVMSLLNGVGDMGTFGDNITSLGSGLVAFALEVSAIDDGQFSEAKINALLAIANGLAVLETNLEGQGGFEDAIEGVKSLSGFSNEMKPFGEGLNDFLTQVRLIVYSDDDRTKVESLISIATSLAVLETNLEGQGGLEDAIAGVKSLSEFSNGMRPFGEGLNDFLTQARLIVYNDEDQTKIENLIDIANALSQLEKSLEAQGGLADKIEGVKSLASFAGGMDPFADGLNSFIAEVSNLKDEDYDQAKIDAALATAEAINVFQKTLPGTDGWWQSVIGTQDLGLFAANVKIIGESLASFASNIGSVDMGDTENALSVMGVIQAFTGELEKTDGLWNKIDQFFGGSSENTLLGTANNMRLVGENLNSFATNVSGLKADKLDNLTEMYQNFGEFINSLSASGDVFSNLAAWAGGSSEKTLISIATDMGIVGSNLKLFSDGIAAIDASQEKFEQFKTLFTSFSGIVNEIIGDSDIWYDSYTMEYLFQSFGNLGSYLNQFYEGLGNLNAERLATAASALSTIVSMVSNAAGIDPANVGTISEILKQFGQTEFAESGDVLGIAFVAAMTEAIQNGATDVQIAATTLGTTGALGAQTTYSVWYTTGQNLGKGLGSGISSMAASVRRSAVNVAAGAIRSIQMTWAVHSPSKVGADLGMYFDLGIAGGLDAYSKVVSDRAANVGESAVKSAATMLRGVDGSIFDNIDPNPTIRPVMDLSSIQAGIGTMNGMLNSDIAPIGLFRGMNFAKGVDALNFDGARISGGMTDKNIVANLEALQNRIDDLNEAVTNMKIVLDSGELVGATSRKIDDSLGTLEMRKGRGN